MPTPIKSKLKDCDMMKNFMTLRSLTRGRELEGDSGRSDATPFLWDDAVMTVYNGHPSLGEAPHVKHESRDPDSPRLGTQGHRGVKAQVSQYIYVYTHKLFITHHLDQPTGQPTEPGVCVPGRPTFTRTRAGWSCSTATTEEMLLQLDSHRQRCHLTWRRRRSTPTNKR
jgi:hypothetical protein